MRYPISLLSVLILSSAPVLAADAPAPAVDRAAAATPPAPATPVLPPAAQPEAVKPVPVTKPVDLFNGKDLVGWNYFVNGKPADPATVVSVKEDGVLAVANKPNGYLMLDPARENYQLHVEWRWTTPNPRPSTNGGVLLNIVPGPLQQNVWPISFQFQLKVTRAGDVISMSSAKCAEADAGKTANREKDASEKPAGEWNSADVTVRGDTIEISVNGVVQNKVTKCVPAAGRIGFQLEGYAYELRNLKLSPLEPEKPAPKPATP
ncbi:MAG TPA: DUF1080 domain-containing protein [Opitutales bacterium]|nr:DUF1080 domain-containing protein [Opitutales bacterium]